MVSSMQLVQCFTICHCNENVTHSELIYSPGTQESLRGLYSNAFLRFGRSFSFMLIIPSTFSCNLKKKTKKIRRIATERRPTRPLSPQWVVKRWASESCSSIKIPNFQTTQCENCHFVLLVIIVVLKVLLLKFLFKSNCLSNFIYMKINL